MDASEQGLVAGRFDLRFSEVIGKGAFCRVYSGLDRVTNMPVAIKMMLNNHSGQLATEVSLLSRKLKGEHFPALYWFGVYQGCETEVLQMLGPSILDLFLDCGHSFSLKTVLMLADVYLSALESLHSKGVVHRDIKPDNLLTGLPGATGTSFFLIDFGLSREFVKEGSHILCKRKVAFQGNMYWASNNVLKGLTSSRRDDVESLLYVLVYLYRGDLPWYVSKERKCRVETVLGRKKMMTAEEICSGMPPVFAYVLAKVQALTFPEAPDYGEYRSAFREVFASLGYKNDSHYDWQQKLPFAPTEVCLEDVDMMNSNGNSFETEVQSEVHQYDGSHRRASSSSASKRGHNRSPRVDFQCDLSPKVNMKKKLAALNTQSMFSPGLLMQKCNSSSSGSPISPPSAPLQHSGSLILPNQDTGFRLRLIQVENEDLFLSQSRALDSHSRQNAETPKRSRPILSSEVRKKYHRTLNL